MRKIILKGEEMTKEELEEFAMDSVKKEIVTQLTRMSPAELFLLSDTFQNQSTEQVHNVVDFMKFIRSFCKFFSDENAEELGDFTENAIDRILDGKVHRELVNRIAGLSGECDDYGD